MNRNITALTAGDIQLNQERKIKQKLKAFKNILAHCLQKIDNATKKDPKLKVFLYEIPLYQNFSIQECAVYVNLKLQQKGFTTYFVEPNKVYISWETPTKPNLVKIEKALGSSSGIKIPSVQSDAIATLRMLRMKIKNELN